MTSRALCGACGYRSSACCSSLDRSAAATLTPCFAAAWRSELDLDPLGQPARGDRGGDRALAAAEDAALLLHVGGDALVAGEPSSSPSTVDCDTLVPFTV